MSHQICRFLLVLSSAGLSLSSPAFNNWKEDILVKFLNWILYWPLRIYCRPRLTCRRLVEQEACLQRSRRGDWWICYAAVHDLVWKFSADTLISDIIIYLTVDVRLSHLFDYVPIIGLPWYFNTLFPMITACNVSSFKVVGQRSRSQGSKLSRFGPTERNRFRIITRVWIDVSQWNLRDSF